MKPKQSDFELKFGVNLTGLLLCLSIDMTSQDDSFGIQDGTLHHFCYPMDIPINVSIEISRRLCGVSNLKTL